MFDPSGRGLEIGPSFSPLLPKADGYDVEILDHASAEDLRTKYAPTGVDIDRIEAVDYVWHGGSIAELIDKPQHYDYCVALHVIEHAVDLLGFLVDCQTLLAPDGVLVLAVPDMRFSFDVLRPWTSLGAVVENHLRQPWRHSPGKVLDEMLYNCTRGEWPAWTRDNVGALRFVRDPTEVRALHDWHMSQKDEFLDIHAWQFTPSSFRLLVSDLKLLNYIEFGEAGFHEAEGEFYITLSRNAASCPVDRLELSKRILTELSRVSV